MICYKWEARSGMLGFWVRKILYRDLPEVINLKFPMRLSYNCNVYYHFGLGGVVGRGFGVDFGAGECRVGLGMGLGVGFGGVGF